MLVNTCEHKIITYNKKLTIFRLIFPIDDEMLFNNTYIKVQIGYGLNKNPAYQL